MPYSIMEGTIGTPPPGDIFVPDTVQKFPLGTIIQGVDPFFGFGEFVYGKAGGSGIGVGRVSYFAAETYVASDIPNTANLGRALMTSVAAMAANTFGWFRTRGMGPWSCTASVAAGTSFGITGAGQVGANSAGKQILNAQIVQPSTYAPTKAGCNTVNGSTRVSVPNIDGLFVGLTVSGTGIPGSTTITAIDSSQNFLTLNNAATATGSVTLTFTWTTFLLVMTNGAFAQGAIT